MKTNQTTAPLIRIERKGSIEIRTARPGELIPLCRAESVTWIKTGGKTS